MLGLKSSEYKKIKEELLHCKRPIFFFHDDADGLCSFLLFYRFTREGKGIIVKSKPVVDTKFVKKVEEFEADKVFVLDLAILEQEFIDLVKVPVIWIDHHQPLDRDNVTYFNPRKHHEHIVYPATKLCYDVVKKDLWLAMVGCIGDWHIPEFSKEFSKNYPDLLGELVTHPGEALFDSKLGELVQAFNFILKGSTKDAMDSVKILTRINSPYEILNQESSQGKFIWGRYQKIKKPYIKLYEEAKKSVTEEEFLIFTYPDRKTSYTGELANELLYRYPQKIIIVGREKGGEIRMSLRSSGRPILHALEKVLREFEGYGGGHENACGACVKKSNFVNFCRRLKEEFTTS